MTKDELQITLAELRKELAGLDQQDDRAREQVNALIARLEQHLADPSSEGGATLRESVSSTLERLEATHPQVTLLLNQLMNTLSGSGI
jgi:Domain of unknown function (DUF4404)